MRGFLSSGGKPGEYLSLNSGGRPANDLAAPFEGAVEEVVGICFDAIFKGRGYPIIRRDQ
jgi:hypothetical protein